MKRLTSYRFLLFQCLSLFIPFLSQPQNASAQQVIRDSVQVLSQPGLNPYECCYTFIVSNHSSGSIREFWIQLISGSGEFISGRAGSPIEWNVFLDRKDIQWLTSTSDAEIDSGESVTSFRFCVRDTGVYRLVWETWDDMGVRAKDTLVFVCSAHNNCDEAFFRALPSIERCGFDIDLLNENGQLKIVNDFHIQLLSPGFSLDTVGHRIPAGWRLDHVDSTTISWKATDGGLSVGDFVENFRIYVQSLGNPTVRLTWWTTNFDTEICHDTLTLLCGLRAPDTLFSRPASVGDDTCCRDFLLMNSHQPRSPLKRFGLVMNTQNGEFFAPPSRPDGWSFTLNAAGDSLLFTIDSFLAPGDSVLFPGICFDNDLAADDTVRYMWLTQYDDLLVTRGLGSALCFRDVIFCDSVTALVDSLLTATQRCITLDLENRNSRRDTIRRFTVKIDNAGTPLRILNAQAPVSWSIDRITPDSVIFHRGTVDPGFDRTFEFCVNIDTNALDPLNITWTTWADNVRPICTESIPVKVDLRLACDSVVIVENDQSVDPLCCFDVTFYNKNGKGRPIDQMSVRVPRVDLIMDTATASGSWSLRPDIFPAVSVDFVGDTLRAGDSVTFSFCVNAIAVQERPVSFDIIWQTLSASQLVCFDTLRVICEGSPGLCDSIEVTATPDADEKCFVWYGIGNIHTPDGPINNVQFTILDSVAKFISADADGSAAGFDQVMLSPKQVIFKGSTIPAGEYVENFRMIFDTPNDSEVILEACTFEDDLKLCCEVDTIFCSSLGVEDETSFANSLLHSVSPNPFTDRTLFHFQLDKRGGVTLLLLDVDGREVKRYEEGMLEAGEHTLVVDGGGLPSGRYFYVLQAGSKCATGRMMLVR